MAVDIFTVYTYGALDVLKNSFNAIATMYTDGSMNKLFKLSLMFGLSWAAIKSGLTRESITHYAKWFGGYLFVILILLQPVDIFKTKGMTLHIRDVVTGKSTKVDHLPPGLVIPAGIISGIGFNMTRLYETLFSKPSPEYLPYHKYGTVFGAQVASEMRNVRIQDPLFKENVEGYITGCMLYDVMIGRKYNIRDLKNSPDLWKFLEEHSSNLRMFNYRHEPEKENKGRRELLTCKQGLKKLAAGFDKESELLAKKFPNLTFLASSKQAGAKRGFTKALQIAGNFYGNLNGSAADQLRQLLIINQFNDTPKSYGVIRGLQNQNTLWSMMGSLGKVGLPVMHAIFQSLIYACFPIVVTLLFFSQRYSSLKTYFELMIWLELWPILFAILNGAVSMFSKNAGVEAVTINNINNAVSTQFTYAMMAHSMALAVPSLAYMIAKGGVGQFVHMAGSLASGTQRGADAAASELTTGSRSLDNVNIGNSSYNNTSANKYDTTGSIFQGSVVQRMPSGALVTDDLYDSNRRVDTGSGITLSRGKLDISKMQSTVSNMRDGISESTANATKEGMAATISSQETQRRAAEFMARHAESIVKGEGVNINENTKEGKTLTRIAKNTMDLQKKFNYDKDQAATAAIKGELQGKVEGGVSVATPQKKATGSGASGSAGGSLDVAVTTTGSATSKDTQGISESETVNITKDNQHVIDSVLNYGKNQRFDSSQSEDKTAVENLSTSYDEFKSHSKSAEFHRSKSEQYQKTLDQIKTSGISVNENTYHEFLGFMAETLHPETDVRLGMYEASRHIDRGDEVFTNALAKYVKAKVPEQVVQPSFNKRAEEIKSGNSGFGDDVKQKIEAGKPTDANVLKATKENKAKIKPVSIADGDKLKQQVEDKITKNEETIEAQNVATRKRAKELKKEVDDKEGNAGFLRKLGIIGEKNRYTEAEYDK